MFISYNFSVFYILTSVGFFVRDIFFKDLCLKPEEDSKIIRDYKKSSKVVFNNFITINSVLLCFDMYYLIIGGVYGFIRTLVYLVIGFPIYVAIYILITRYKENSLYLSSVDLRVKDNVTLNTPFLILYFDPKLFVSILKIWTPFVLCLLAINEYVLNWYVSLIFQYLIFYNSNLRLPNMRLYDNKLVEIIELYTDSYLYYVECIYQYSNSISNNNIVKTFIGFFIKKKKGDKLDITESSVSNEITLVNKTIVHESDSGIPLTRSVTTQDLESDIDDESDSGIPLKRSFTTQDLELFETTL